MSHWPTLCCWNMHMSREAKPRILLLMCAALIISSGCTSLMTHTDTNPESQSQLPRVYPGTSVDAILVVHRIASTLIGIFHLL